jgi:hypothetical protein
MENMLDVIGKDIEAAEKPLSVSLFSSLLKNSAILLDESKKEAFSRCPCQIDSRVAT